MWITKEKRGKCLRVFVNMVFYQLLKMGVFDNICYMKHFLFFKLSLLILVSNDLFTSHIILGYDIFFFKWTICHMQYCFFFLILEVLVT